MTKFEATWRLNWFDAFLTDLEPLHRSLLKLAEAHSLDGTIKKDGRLFVFNLRGDLKDCESFKTSLNKVRGTI
jgi:hypothetical protein